MFTWICEKCGYEVPPHMSECPNCADAKAAAAAPPAPVQPPAAAPAPPAQQAAPGVTYIASPPRSSVPGWLVGILVAVGLTGAMSAGLYFFLPSFRGDRSAPRPPAAAAPGAAKLETPPVSLPTAESRTHPMAKFIELTAFRVREDARRNAVVRFAAVNHSEAELPPLTLKVDLKVFNAAPGAPPVTSFEVKLPGLGPHEVKDMSANAQTTLRAYEFPDWQFLRADFTITSP